jgi:hypothetical protein
MIQDLQSMFSGAVSAAGVRSGQAVTVTAISTNVLDLRQAAAPALADEGISGEPLYLVVQVGTAATAAGAATVTISLESDSTADLATSATVHFTTSAIGKATLVAGFTAVRIPLPLDNYERYLGVRYTVATGPLTAGDFFAFLTPNVQRNIIYPVGFTVS